MLDLKTVNDVLVRAMGRGDRDVMLWQDAAGGTRGSDGRGHI
jgi:long-chain acyl-CoA synthetase